MNKKIFLLIVVILPSIIYAHSLLLNMLDNEDNTIYIQGVFSTGEPANGAQIKLEAINSGKVLYKKRLPPEGELIVPIPNIAYKVILNGGPGHKIVKDGIAPKEGFIKEDQKTKTINQSVDIKEKYISENTIILIAMIIASILFILTILVSIFNTNRLIRKIKYPKE